MSMPEQKKADDKQFFNMLRSSVLASKDATPEEVAIWLELNGFSTSTRIERVLTTIAAHYHKEDDYVLSMQAYGECFFSTWAFKNMFNALFKTSAFDNQICSSTFVKKMMSVRNKFYYAMKNDKHYPSKADGDLYEVFSELLERIDAKKYELGLLK